LTFTFEQWHSTDGHIHQCHAKHLWTVAQYGGPYTPVPHQTPLNSGTVPRATYTSAIPNCHNLALKLYTRYLFLTARFVRLS
jgi:hypothetical protein